MWHYRPVLALFQIVLQLLTDLAGIVPLAVRRHGSLAAEILMLRRQLALYVERGVKPRRIDFATRVTLTLLSRFFNWRDALVVVRPETMIRWHRAGWRLFWRLKSRPGRPGGDLRWSTFLRLHAQGIIACDFLIAVTATFRLLYVFVVSEHRSRRLIHCNITAHPSATWTLQQLRDAIGFQDRYEYLLHDRDSIFAKHLDESIAKLGVRVLKSPPRSPTANAICERVIGTIRRECLDWLIPLSESHLRSILKSWIPHYNKARPHMALGPGLPDPPTATHPNFNSRSRHRLREDVVVRANVVLGGLHHEYFLAPTVAPLSICG